MCGTKRFFIIFATILYQLNKKVITNKRNQYGIWIL